MSVFMVGGMLFGDEGKATSVDFLTRYFDAKVNVRFQGGDQAAHNNVLPDGRHHCHAQLGSGMFLPWVETYLSKFMLVNPVSLVSEAEIFNRKANANVFPRIIIHPDCLVITPIHSVVNKVKEIMRGNARHGSCGRGVGETALDKDEWFALRIKDLFRPRVVLEKLLGLRANRLSVKNLFKETNGNNQFMIHELENKFSDDYIGKLIDFYKDFISIYGIRFEDDQYLKDMIDQEEKIIFEGAQGVLLDVDHGFKPYVTKTATTFKNADAILDTIGYAGPRYRFGVTRGVFISRHGHGPFPTYDPKLSEIIPEVHNKGNEWQSDFRIGWLDKLLLDYALGVTGGVDRLIVTHADHLSKFDGVKVCTSYSYQGSDFDSILALQNAADKDSLTDKLMAVTPNYDVFDVKSNSICSFMEQMFGIPVGVISSGPTFKDKQLIKNLQD